MISLEALESCSETTPLDEILSMPCNCDLLPSEVITMPLFRKAGFSDKMTEKE